MNHNRLERRNTTLDLIRVVAVFTVLSVHFFLHNGFYSESVNGMGPIEGLLSFFQTSDPTALHGPTMFAMVTMRTLFGVCVPLFLILTGYLMSGKTLSKKYYLGIRKTLIIFVLASVFCMLFKSIHETPAAKEAFYRFDLVSMFRAIGETGQYTFKHYLLSIFDFTGANYSWYIEMYIGLFLIAPFLNLGYSKLKNQKQKQVLLATFIFICILPSIFNLFNFDTATWWATPTENDSYQKLLPSFWMGFYPVAYYYTGAYIREYGMKLRTRSLLAVFAASLFLFSAFNWFRSYDNGFKTTLAAYWYGIEPYVLSALLFVLLSRIRSDNWHPTVRMGLWKLSDLALGIYLMSFVSDELIYQVLRQNVPVMVNRLAYYIITVPLSFLCAAMMSLGLSLLEKLIMFLYYKIKAFVLEQKARDDRQKWQDVLFCLLLSAGLIFSFWKCPYGFGGNDEAFYLTIPQRLLQGDALFADEWHLSQLSSLLLLPFYWLYTTFAGSTEGIMLAARITYIILHATSCCLIYVKLRKHGYLAVIASVLFFIYTPYNIMALSYDTMGLGLVTLAGVLLATADYSKKLQIIFSGLAFGGAVLCCPYLIFAYVLFLIGVGVHLLLRKKDMRFVLKSEMFAPKTLLFFTIGAAALGAVCLAFILSRTGFGDIFHNLGYMLKDPEHPSLSFGTRLNYYFKTIFESHAHFKYPLYAYGVMLLVMLFDRKRKLHRTVYLIITTAVVIYMQVLYLPNLHSSTYNAIMFPMFFMGVTAYILCDNKPRELFAGLFVLGIIYSFCISFSSNQYFYVISMASAACNVASYIFLGQLIREMHATPDNITYAVVLRRFSLVFVALMIFLQGAFQIGSKARHVFWDSEPSQLTSTIADGPAKGLRTNANNYSSYEKIYRDIRQQYDDKQPDNILFLTNRTWTYLAADFPYGTFSAWLSGERDSSLDRLREFYQINPDKMPKYIYIPKESDWDIQKILADASRDGYKITRSDTAYQAEK